METDVMNSPATEQSQDSKRKDTKSQTSKSQISGNAAASLDNRYGKIGISAVAAALRCQHTGRTGKGVYYIPYERD